VSRTPAARWGPALAALLTCLAMGAPAARADEPPSPATPPDSTATSPPPAATLPDSTAAPATPVDTTARSAPPAAAPTPAPAASAPALSGAQQDPSCFRTALVPAPGVAVMRLPRGFLRAGSDSVWSRAGAWSPGRDYRLDPLRGDLRLLRMLAPGDTVWVRACGLVLPPPLEYQRQVYRPARPAGAPDTASAHPDLAASARPATARDPGVAPTGAALAVNGNKTIAVDFGSTQDAALRQSLDLSVSGHVAPGVELTGVLSDRDTPLSAAGTTQDLQSIDRVLLELKSRDGSGALGDIPLAITHGDFARLDRRVQGVTGEWHPGNLSVRAAAAGSQGEYARLQFQGVDGLQGPYTLTDGKGGTGIAVVAGSEVVTVDGVRMTRGEAADYSMDYERARLTFSNRRPISSASRITVEYQFALTRFRRNLALAASEWRQGSWSFYAQALSEGDDAGRPITGTYDAIDRRTLAQAGDSLALGPGVTPGIGDYDTVRVAGQGYFAFAGLDSGSFAVQFARVTQGRGDYADSGLVGGRVVYRFVGAGLGTFVVGHALPAPESHKLASVGTSFSAGPLHLDAEGALSSLDHNTLSARDDADDAGGAGRVTLSSEGQVPLLPGRAGVSAGFRAVEQRFTPFSALERPFAEEDWGLAPGSDLEHQRRADASAWWRPAETSELRAELSRMSTPDGYTGTRRTGDARLVSGPWSATAALLDAGGTSASLAFPHGGRARANGELRLRGAWLVPALRAESDRRDTPSDTAAIQDRVHSVDADLSAGSRVPFRLALGAGVRQDEHDAGRTETRTRATTLRTEVETPPAAPLGASITAQRRDTRDEASGALVRQDLASTRMHADWKPAGLSSSLQIERTNEAENRRVRVLTFVGPGRGSYDGTGNFVGLGDYDLVLSVSPALDRFARTATSARAAWSFGRSEAWHGSRVEFTLEDEARRRGDGRLADVFLSTGAALVDTGLAGGSILQRLEAELAPGSRVAALRARAERRVSTDRTFENFGQSTDQRTGALRWRARPGVTTSAEAEARVQWQRATQALAGGANFTRTLVDEGGTAQLVWQPGPAQRLAAVFEATWSRPQGATLATRTLQIGPDLASSIGRAGRAELTVRRAFVSGPPALALLPSADPAGAARWNGTARFDWRLHETTTFGLNADARERPGRRTVVTGRAEVRAFF
jgi:hypothetical protein